jgi:hypothetical protein
MEAVFPNMPVVELSLVVTDDEAAPHVTRGGDYRSGRFTRCRVEARQGERLAPMRRWSEGLGGGLAGRGILRRGESIRLAVALADYVALDTPGEQRIVVMYHDSDSIVDLPQVDDRILVTSGPFTLRWTPLVLRRSAVDQAPVAELLARIDPDAPVVITMTPYQPGLEYSREEPAGEEAILRLGWAALPGLLEALDEEDLTLRRRAWVLGLLFDLTGAVEPRGLAALGRYVEVAGFGDSPFLMTRPWTVNDGPIQVAAQRQLVDRWRELAVLIRVED